MTKKPVCANCHFLKLYGGIEGSIQKNPDDKDRNSIRNGDFDVVTKFTDEMELVFECHLGVWSEGYNGRKGYNRSKKARQKEINEKLRIDKDSCFFLEYKPGMMYHAAEELQKRDYELEKLKINVTKLANTKNEIFIVHGHDEAMKYAVAITLQKLNLKYTILHEQANQGRTIIEKFIKHSQESSFAVVLLSPDDKGFSAKDSPDKSKYRARQNVIFELGFFIGHFGREKVVTLCKHSTDFEVPSDYSGTVFVRFDDTGQWKFELVKELKACGFEVDANKLI